MPLRFFICYSLQNYRIRQGRNDLNSIHLHDDTAYYPCVDIIKTGSSLSPENDSSQKDIRGYSLTQTLLHTSVLQATKHCPQLKDILRIWGHQGNTFGHDSWLFWDRRTTLIIFLKPEVILRHKNSKFFHELGLLLSRMWFVKDIILQIRAEENNHGL